MPSAFAAAFISPTNSVDGARDVLGERHGRVVAGLDQQAAQQILDADVGVHLDEHPRAARAPGLLADVRAIVESDAARLRSAPNTT